MESQLQQVTEHCDTLTQRYEEATSNVQKLQELLRESDHDRHQLKGRNQILEQQVVLLFCICAQHCQEYLLSICWYKECSWSTAMISVVTVVLMHIR